MAKKNYGATLESKVLESLFKKTGNGFFMRVWIARYEKYNFGKEVK